MRGYIYNEIVSFLNTRISISICDFNSEAEEDYEEALNEFEELIEED